MFPKLILMSFFGVRFMKYESLKSASFVTTIKSPWSANLQISESFAAIPHEKTTEDNPLQMIQIKFVAINIFRTNFGKGWHQIGC